MFTLEHLLNLAIYQTNKNVVNYYESLRLNTYFLAALGRFVPYLERL